MAKEVSRIHSSFSGAQMRAQGALQLSASDITNAAVRELNMLGISINPRHVAAMVDGIGMDAAEPANPYASPISGLSNPSIATPIQFLQEWLPGFVRYITAARKIDQLVGLATVGAWEDEEVVQGALELLGGALPYSDYGNIPLTSWNANYEGRTVVRFELGFNVGLLEEARTARARINSATEKRSSVTEQLEIRRNEIGFYGFNDGTNRTFGFLNDPNLLPAITVPAGAAGGTEWSGKTFLEITADIQAAIARLMLQSEGRIDPKELDLVLALPLATDVYMGTVSQYSGESVREWLTKTYPRIRIETAPQLLEAIGGVDVAYLYPENVDDGSSDDGKVFIQMVPTKFMSLGVDKGAKDYTEDFANATAGCMLKRPYAVVRLLGV